MRRIFATHILAGSDEADFHSWSGLLDQIEHDVSGMRGVECERTGGLEARKPLPLLRIRLSDAEPGAAYAVINELLEGEPAIALGESYAEHNVLIVNPHGLTESEASVVGQRLRAALIANSGRWTEK